MKMKKLFSFTLSILFLLGAVSPALAIDEELFPAEPEITEDTQVPDEAVPPVDEPFPDVPPVVDEPFPDEDVPPPVDEPFPDEDVPPPVDEPFPDEDVPPPVDEPFPDEDVPLEEDEPFPDEDVPPSEDEPFPDETAPPADEPFPDETVPPEDELFPDETVPPEDEPLPEMPEDDLIDVVVPAVGEVMLNPYGLAVETAWGTNREQVQHQPQPLTNNSNFPVIVTATATGALAGDAWFVTAPPEREAEEKELFLYVEYQSQPDVWQGAYTGAPNQLLVTEYGSSGEVLTLEAGAEGYYRLFGSMSPTPQTMWSSDNALTVTLAYTFTRDPSSQPEELPPVELPPVELPPEELPPVELPPVELPPEELPPVEMPPEEMPPVELPPEEAPPVELPPEEAPPEDSGAGENETISGAEDGFFVENAP